MREISRREFLRAVGAIAIAAGGTAVAAGCAPLQSYGGATAAPLATLPPQTDFSPDVEINLRAVVGQTQILPGAPTRVWKYEAELIHGAADSLQPLENTYLGPLIRVRPGQKVRIHFRNDLPEPTIVHWHGLILPERMDGHPCDVIATGETYLYEFEVLNRPGMYWYHPHPDMLTGGQVMRGLAGLFLVTDDAEAALLPAGAQDIPLVLQDRTFDSNNQFVYAQGGAMGGMPGMAMMMGFLGDQILVNGAPNTALPLATRAYRLRLLNGSNSRDYKLGWESGAPMVVLGTDGGLLERPVERPYVMLGPGQRVELWADFSDLSAGDEVTLQSLAFVGAEGDSLMAGGMGSMGGMGGMMGYNPQLPNGNPFPILKIRIERQEDEILTLPTAFAPIARYRLEDAVNADQPRRFALTMRNMRWQINGRSFEMEAVAPNEIVQVGTLEAWEFVNEQNPGQMMEAMGMVHPIHVHGVQFQVQERTVTAPELKAGWDSVHEGYVDDGWMDTVLVMPGEQVRVLMRFAQPGIFVYHCHNLEHEDMGMMRNYRAEA